MTTATMGAGAWSARAAELHGEGWQLLDLAGLDRLRLPTEGPRFEVVVQLLHHDRKERLTIRVAAEGDPPTIPSVTELWPTANFMEREAFDMFGIAFDGHPNLTRILMPDEWEGYPLRKDYGVGKVPVEFVEQALLQIDSPGQSPKHPETGVHLDHLGQVVVEGDAP
jgi:NADH-quinone oxidoreductase subunit C